MFLERPEQAQTLRYLRHMKGLLDDLAAAGLNEIELAGVRSMLIDRFAPLEMTEPQFETVLERVEPASFPEASGQQTASAQ
jgi:DNA-binding sugar fermentation-stimulating protein